MKITKRDGSLEKLSFDKITLRLRKLSKDVSLSKLTSIDTDIIAQKVVSGLYDGITSTELDEEAARISISMIENMEYGKMASRIVISSLHKNTKDVFSDTMEDLYNHKNMMGVHTPILADDFIKIVRENKERLNESIDLKRDYIFDYFGFKTLEKSYLMKINNVVVERPQYLYMRVALQVHKDDIENVIKTYDLISQHYFTFASPTIFNSGSRLQNLSSCFLIGTDDSIGGIYKTITDCAHISKVGGGIGVHISNIRSKGSVIRGTNGVTDGIIPMLRVYNTTATYVNQSSRRKGSFAMYLSPEHPDIMDFLDLRKNQGSEYMRARDLFYAMWIPDLFMKQVKLNGDWYLMDPDESPGLNDKYGDEYEELYWRYVGENKYRKKIKAQDIWTKILDSQIETGTPYMLYKDQANLKNNQENIGTIKSSNLCAEILLYSDSKEYACCNLCSIALPKYVEYDKSGKAYFNHDKLYEVAKHTILPMNNVIDFNFYPVPEAEMSNMKNRPIGVGVQGLSDVFILLRLEFEGTEAAKLNKEIFETLYYGCLMGSMELSKIHGPYSTFEGSPFSKGELQFDLWKKANNINEEEYISGRWDWGKLKEDIKEHGVRNSTLTTCMPTASSAQIMGNTESIEAFDSCIFKRRVLSGEYIVANKHLVSDLTKLGLWSKEMKDTIIAHNGSVQKIAKIPEDLKKIYKTVWEMSMKTIINQSADRGVFIDMTQSLNCFMESPTLKKLSSMHFYGWSKNLKTGMYYLRSKNSSSASKFTIDPELEKQAKLQCSIDNKEECEMCSS